LGGGGAGGGLGGGGDGGGGLGGGAKQALALEASVPCVLSYSKNAPAAATSAQLRAMALPSRQRPLGVLSTNEEAPAEVGDLSSTWVAPAAHGATPAAPLAFHARHALWFTANETRVFAGQVIAVARPARARSRTHAW
jgi:hypothetical protein